MITVNMPITKKTLRYTVVLKHEPEGGYTVLVPALPGCVTYGKTIKQAKKMAAEAIDGYIASLEKHHEPIPCEGEIQYYFQNVKLSRGYVTATA